MSGRIRTVKPEWLDDELLALASSDARVLSIALVLLADDYGNGRANEVMLAGRVFPGKPPEVLAKAIEELASIRYLILYEVDGQRYFSIRSWKKHQKVDKPGRPRVPGPILANIPETSENPLASRDPGTGPDPIPGPGPDPGPERLIPCPSLEQLLTREQRASLETSMVPGWAIDAMVAELHVTLAGSSKRMPLDGWHSYAAKAITRRWNNPNERPKKPAGAPSEAELKRILAAREAASQRELEEHLAKVKARVEGRKAEQS